MIAWSAAPIKWGGVDKRVSGSFRYVGARLGRSNYRRITPPDEGTNPGSAREVQMKTVHRKRRAGQLNATRAKELAAKVIDNLADGAASADDPPQKPAAEGT